MSYLVKRTTREKLGEVMAKKKEVEAVETVEAEETGKKLGFFQMLFYWFVIPVAFTLAIVLIIAQVTNTNVFQIVDDAVAKLPFVDSEEEMIESTALNQEKVVELQAKIQEKEAEVTKLQSEVESANAKNEELVIEIERLNYEIETLQRQQTEVSKDQQEILKTFETMSAKKAAPIILELSDDEAMRILAGMKTDTLSAILTNMPPAEAAKYTELLSQQ